MSGVHASIELARVGLTELTALLERGELSALDLTRGSLGQIERLDAVVNAVIACNPEAEAIARELDAERRAGTVRGPLHGIPILLKDNVDTGDCMPTTAGSLALEGSLAPADAPLVARLRAAGAVVLGKTNLSEWANRRSSRSSSGWSSLGGQTRNPYAPERSPGGSSSGSGVAVACGMCVAAVGTETDGSVLIPASLNAVVGIKPTLGLVSRTGIVPVAHSQDTAGPMARSVRDAALVLGVMAGSDPGDPLTVSSAGLPASFPDLDEGALSGVRVGVVRTYCGQHEGVDGVVEETIAALRTCGAEVLDGVTMTTVQALRDVSTEVLLYEMKHDLAAYLATRRPRLAIRTLADVVEFNRCNAPRAMPYFGQDLLVAAAAKGDLTEPAYRCALAQARRLAGRDGIDAALARHRLDALLAPTTGPAWSIDLVNGDHRSPPSTSPAAIAGYPSVSVPAGYVHGLPVGVSFFGAAQADARLIGYAHAFEQATRVRRPPELAKSA
jgi:amidase